MIHGVSCQQSIADILVKAKRLRLGSCERVLGVRWLLGERRRRGKWVSSVVVYFSGVVLVRGRCVRFGGGWRPVDRYEFDRPARWSEAGGRGALSDAGW